MKTARTVRLVAHLCLTAVGGTTILASGALLSACNDENDPATWVKRLDDPIQRAAAIKRLQSVYDDATTKANKNTDDPKVKALVDTIVEPLTKVYTSATLDEKTRKDLIKLLADMRDPRAAPAWAKAFNEYEAGHNDEDVKFSAQAISALAKAGKLTDQ